MSRSDEQKKRKKKHKTDKGHERNRKSKHKQKKSSKKSRRLSVSHEKDDSQEALRNRGTSDSGRKHRNGESSSDMKRDRYNDNRKSGGRESSHTKHANSPSLPSSTGERSKSPEAERICSPSSAGRGGGLDQYGRGRSVSRRASNGRYSRHENGDSPSRERPRNHKRARSHSVTRSPTRSMKDHRRSSRGRPHHSKDRVARSRAAGEEKVGLHGPRRDTGSRHWRSRDSSNRFNERSQSPERKRWSPSPSPTAPTRRRQSNSRHREPAISADRSRRESNGSSPPRREGLGHRRGSRLSPPHPTAEQRSKSTKDLSHDEATAQQPTANASSGKESDHGDRSEEAAVTRRPPKESPRASDETHRQAHKSSGRKKPSGKKALLSFGDDIGEEEGGSSEFQGLRAATLNEFKRNQRSQTSATLAPAVANILEETPIAAGRFDELVKQRGALLGPPKISTAECRGQREYQEDRHVVVLCFHSPNDVHTKFEANPPSFFAVYDGHNGVFASEIAKSKLHAFVAKAAPSTGLLGEPPERLEGLLRAAFASTEAEILEKAEEDGDRQDGTTITACLLAGDLLVTANVGDSRAVLGSVGRGNKLHCRDISTDHKPEITSEKRRIEAAGGEVVFNGCFRIQHEDVACRLAVSRSLGDKQFKGQRLKEKDDGAADGKAPLKRKEQLVSPEPAVKSIRLASRDRVVIVASDGLWDVMTGLEAVEIALASHERTLGGSKRAPSWANALTSRVTGDTSDIDPATALMKEAVKRETADNVTVVVVILPWN